jgi:hypothetical protein
MGPNYLFLAGYWENISLPPAIVAFVKNIYTESGELSSGNSG